MSDAPPPATAEIVEALKARAAENERLAEMWRNSREFEAEDTVADLTSRAKLDRLAASRLAELAADNERMREALDDLLMAYVGPTAERESRLTAVIIKHSLQPEHAQARIAAREKSK